MIHISLAGALNTNPIKLAKKIEGYKKGLLADPYDKAKKATAGLVSKLDLVNFGFKLGAEYTGVKNLTLKPVDALKISGSVEVTINFGMKGIKEFRYLNTGINGALNMRYEWK